MKTQDYNQPPFYHFAQDSIALAKYAAERFSELTNVSAVDLFAGCGVVGIEFCYRHQSVKKLVCVEIQNEFQTSLNKNLSRLGRGKVLWGDFAQVNLASFDVVLANPPHFLTGSGREPADQNKYHCRFICDSAWKKLVELMCKHKGAVMLVDGAQSHVKDLIEQRLFKVVQVLPGKKWIIAPT